ncbi:MAG: hypothetical protein VX679_04340 [Pseudomonadota bacterium]|nr:hypothetical protein [Pseudomonadota bacterium]
MTAWEAVEELKLRLSIPKALQASTALPYCSISSSHNLASRVRLAQLPAVRCRK